MATIVAAQTGNWSVGATWDGGVKPGAGDTAQTGAYTVTIDENLSCTKLEATSSGHFEISAAHTLTADLENNSSYGGAALECLHNSGTVAIVGSLLSSAKMVLRHLDVGTVSITGNVTGGSGFVAFGVRNNSTGTVSVTGNVTGGSGSSASGISNYIGGTVTVDGICTGSAADAGAYAVENVALGTVHIKRALAGAAAPALRGSNVGGVTTFKELQLGAEHSIWPLSGYCSMEIDVDVNQVIVKRSDTGADYGLSNDYPAVEDVADGVFYKLGTLEGELAGGVCDYPSEDDVRFGVDYDTANYTGNMTLPAVGNVRDGVTYGTDGTEFEGTLELPAEDDVEDSVGYGEDGSEFTGTVTLPTEVQVEDTVQYGADGIEFTGSLAGGGAPDWTDDEKKQIRQALGITGTKAATSGGNLDAVLADTGELQTEWADGGRLDLILDAKATSAELASESDVATAVRTELETNGSKLDHLWEMTEDDGGIRRLTTNALEQTPTGSGLTARQTRDAMKLAPSLGAPVAGSVDAHLDSIQAKTDTIGALTVTLTAPVATAGNAITVIRGDDYLLADGRELSFTGTNWPVITGGAVALIVRFPTVTSYTGVVTGAAACYIELTDTQTALLTPGVYDYDLQATLAGVGGSVITLAQGTFTVSADVR